MTTREIKFRIFLGKRFFYWGFIGDSFVGLPNSTEEQLTMEELKNRSQRFTGLLDKNGKEIYEGDIVRDTCEIAQIYYSTEYAKFVRGKKIGGLFSNIHEAPLEVIGNIFENPNLIK